MRNAMMILGASLLTLALVSVAPLDMAATMTVNPDAATQVIHTMSVYSPLDPISLVGGSAGIAASGPLLYGGGNIEKTPNLYICYWGWTSDPSGEKPYLQGFFNGIGGSSWFQTQTQYSSNSQGFITNPTGDLKGTWSDSTSVPSKPSQTAVNNAGIRCMNHFGYDVNANYMVATPSGHSQSGFGTRWCAYHESLSTSSGPTAVTYMPYMTDAGTSCGKNFINSGSAGLLDGVSIVGGHEFAEAATDPVPCTGWCTSGGSETGDLCAWLKPPAADITLTTGTFAVQGLWSNSANACVIS
ncbi:MAG: hypothetical protein ACYDCK_03830 [Thermoplasmatota archaeon]